jgi:solute carrier family 34 (sodium-dependent phosphate cotransporter)
MGVYIAVTLIIFLFAINLMVASLHNLGAPLSESILVATSNPFNGLFIGLLITALLQSSSTSTALVVALVASRAIPVSAAVPIIMGANIGTTITSTIVSLGFISRKKEFRRAVAIGSFHDFFNILTALILFPLEYHYGLLTRVSSRVADLLFVPVLQPVEQIGSSSSPGLSPLIQWLNQAVPSPLFLVVAAMTLLFGSILIFRRVVSGLLQVEQPQFFRRFFFRNPLKSFSWGVVLTAAIRSSTITTSVVVPMVAKKLVSLKQAAVFIIGANMGTTITAFIAVSLNQTTREAIIIASVHILFNLFGVLVFLPVPGLRRIPLALANGLGRLTLRYRLAGFVYLLSTFFFIPFMLIYFNQDAVEHYRLTYEKNIAPGKVIEYTHTMRLNKRTMQGELSVSPRAISTGSVVPVAVMPVTVKNKTAFIGKDMWLFGRKGSCWDQEVDGREYKTCVNDIVGTMKVGAIAFDSVYVFHRTGRNGGGIVSDWYYFSRKHTIRLLHERDSEGRKTVVEKLTAIEVN